MSNNGQSNGSGIRNWGKVFVTGGGGHLGANLVRRLLDEGLEVRALAHPEHNNSGLDGLDIERVSGELGDLETLRRHVKGCDRVFHCAAKISTLHTRPEQQLLYEANVVGTRNLLIASQEADVQKVVVTGSFSAVGYDPADPAKPTAEDTLPYFPFMTHMPYGRTKHLSEYYCWKAGAQGLPVVVATSCAIIGANDYIPSRLGRTLCDFANGKLRAYIPGGFEFVAAKDVVAGHMLAMEKGRSGHKYIFNTEYMDVDRMMELFEEVTGTKRPSLRLPAKVMTGVAHVTTFIKQKFFPDQPHRFTPLAVYMLSTRRHADNTKAREELGYQPGNMRDAIRESYEFFCQQGAIRN